jgi:hypothetical protein
VDVCAQAPQGVHLAEMLVHAFDDDGGIGAALDVGVAVMAAFACISTSPVARVPEAAAGIDLDRHRHALTQAASLSASSITMRRR